MDRWLGIDSLEGSGIRLDNAMSYVALSSLLQIIFLQEVLQFR